MDPSAHRSPGAGPTIGIVGDRDPSNPTHRATERAFAELAEPIGTAWIATDEIAGAASARIAGYAGLLIAPGSPYRSMEGALSAIRHAREARIPVLGTCGGFQHIAIEFARDVLGIADADHQETSPGAPRLAVTALACSLAGQDHAIRLIAGTRAAALYGVTEAVEPFFCRFGLNPEYRARFEARGLTVSGVGEDGEVRVVELADHPFFVGTLFVPQARTRPGTPHPLIAALADAARASASR